MPLLIVTGLPSSGKTTVSERIADFFKSKDGKAAQNVQIVSDDLNGSYSSSIYNDSHQEREQRSFLRSEVQKRLAKESPVICDSLNYIKGFRYELFCIAKLVKTTYCVVQCSSSKKTCTWLNSFQVDNHRYTDDTLDALSMRYEPPEEKNRWDSPLFRLEITKEAGPKSVDIPFDNIYRVLFEGQALPPNLSTQSAPLAATNFLYELDRATQQVVQSIVELQKTAVPGDFLTVASCADKVEMRKVRSLAELSRLRRQFMTYTKSHPVEDIDKIASLFVNFLNNNR
uniref:Protein KTI12 homolog n=1 Tax=Plectus sambesii TaxID=2011161 RepID=A0A914WIW7_9BILA